MALNPKYGRYLHTFLFQLLSDKCNLLAQIHRKISLTKTNAESYMKKQN